MCQHTLAYMGALKDTRTPFRCLSQYMWHAGCIHKGVMIVEQEHLLFYSYYYSCRGWRDKDCGLAFITNTNIFNSFKQSEKHFFKYYTNVYQPSGLVLQPTPCLLNDTIEALNALYVKHVFWGPEAPQCRS